jgi:putative membrane protein
VGPFGEAAQVLWCLAPTLVAPDLEPMWREALRGSGPAAGFTRAPRRARWLDPLAWRRIAYAVTPDALVIRSGRIVRKVVVVPHARTQALSAVQGPWQRRWRLATVWVHSTLGPVIPLVRHLDESEAGRLVRDQTARARPSRAHVDDAGPHPA